MTEKRPAAVSVAPARPLGWVGLPRRRGSAGAVKYQHIVICSFKKPLKIVFGTVDAIHVRGAAL